MTSPPSRGPGLFHLENLGLDRGCWLRHGQCFRYWARSAAGRGTLTHVHADFELCRGPGVPTRLGHRGPPKMSLFLLLAHLQP